MYNKLFSKILDSSVWLEPTPTRIVWLTFIAAMDEDGMVQFASISNVAHRARVSEEEAKSAIVTLEGPDPNSADPSNEGRRIERVPGGWMVLNAAKYRDLATREIAKERTRQRVAKFRARQSVTVCNAVVTPTNDPVTQSEAYTDTHTETKHMAAPSELGLVCDEVPKSLNTFEFLEVWGKWKEYRMAIKRTGKRAIALTFNAQLKKLSSLPVQEAIAQINQSIEKGWTGLFEVQKGNGHSNGKSNGASLILYNDEYKRVLDTMRVIRSQYQDHQSWTQSDLDKYGKLKARKAELKTLLGIVA